jgi:hypothetical protein
MRVSSRRSSCGRSLTSPTEVLFKRRTLEGIAAGVITLAFRRWERPRVRAGTRMRTAIGVVGVDAIDVVTADEITEEDARRAGFASREQLFDALPPRARGPVHRIRLHYAGPDPRLELRRRDAISPAEVEEIEARLARVDAASRVSPWTSQTLELIEAHPAVRAADLAESIGSETQPFKRRVRRLKELGLTESLDVGYRLSPRGRAYMERRRLSPRADEGGTNGR